MQNLAFVTFVSKEFCADSIYPITSDSADCCKVHVYARWTEYTATLAEARYQVPIAFSSFQCAQGEAKVLAATAPDAATAGTPMPGNVESPQHSKPAHTHISFMNQALTSLVPHAN